MNSLEKLLVNEADVPELRRKERARLRDEEWRKNINRVPLSGKTFADVIGRGPGTYVWIGEDDMKCPTAMIHAKELRQIIAHFKAHMALGPLEELEPEDESANGD